MIAVVGLILLCVVLASRYQHDVLVYRETAHGLSYGVQSHADSEALAASKIAASRAASACVKLPDSAENMVRLECTLDSKRLIIEASGGRTVAFRADAVIF